jgi:hypothetical protein
VLGRAVRNPRIPYPGPDTRGRPADIPRTGSSRSEALARAIGCTPFNRLISMSAQSLARDRCNRMRPTCVVGTRGALSFSRFGVTQRHFSQEIVMRNFIYAITLVGLGMLQLAIVVVEIARV